MNNRSEIFAREKFFPKRKLCKMWIFILRPFHVFIELQKHENKNTFRNHLLSQWRFSLSIFFLLKNIWLFGFNSFVPPLKNIIFCVVGFFLLFVLISNEAILKSVFPKTVITSGIKNGFMYACLEFLWI